MRMTKQEMAMMEVLFCLVDENLDAGRGELKGEERKGEDVSSSSSSSSFKNAEFSNENPFWEGLLLG